MSVRGWTIPRYRMPEEKLDLADTIFLRYLTNSILFRCSYDFSFRSLSINVSKRTNLSVLEIWFLFYYYIRIKYKLTGLWNYFNFPQWKFCSIFIPTPGNFISILSLYIKKNETYKNFAIIFVDQRFLISQKEYRSIKIQSIRGKCPKTKFRISFDARTFFSSE